MHDKNKDIKSFTGNTFKWVLFLTVLPRVVFIAQSKVYGGAFLLK